MSSNKKHSYWGWLAEWRRVKGFGIIPVSRTARASAHGREVDFMTVNTLKNRVGNTAVIKALEAFQHQVSLGAGEMAQCLRGLELSSRHSAAHIRQNPQAHGIQGPLLAPGGSRHMVHFWTYLISVENQRNESLRWAVSSSGQVHCVGKRNRVEGFHYSSKRGEGPGRKP